MLNTMDETERRVAVVTGGARGIGAAVVDRFAEEGKAVSVWDVDGSGAEGRASTVTERGGRAQAVDVDVSDPDAVTEATEETLDRFGRIDVLVNNAGIVGESGPLWEQEIEAWNRVLGVNLNGAFHCSRAVVPHMREQGWGRVVNVSSIAGKEGIPSAAPYSVSKAGIIALTKSLGEELATDGVLVNCVTPAVIRTEMLEQVSEEYLQDKIDQIPMGRLGEPEEVAELVSWLGSNACSFTTGAVFDLSGGRATY
jgi:3-oxoacyl-[acyl-carrier protein] reductase